VYLIKQLNPGREIELLIPDFMGSADALSLVVASCPDVIAHNLETVESMYPEVRPQGNYRRALRVLEELRKLGFAGFIKSGIMLGFGEPEEEILKAIEDLKYCGCDILTLGQYLAPSKEHFPVREFVSQEKFESYRQRAVALGFKAVYAGALVRSSYRAEEVYSQIRG
jgi:lipoic acid synthetase